MGTEASVNGSLPYFSGLMDGANITSPMSDNVIFNPMFDSIAEVKMSDSLFSAQYGMGGVLYNQITKGGGDKLPRVGVRLHREYYLQCGALWFRDWSRTACASPRHRRKGWRAAPDSTSQQTSFPFLWLGGSGESWRFKSRIPERSHQRR